MTDSILDKVIASKEQKAREEKERRDLAICPKCGSEMIDQSFIRGNKIAGSMSCKCGLKIYF